MPLLNYQLFIYAPVENHMPLLNYQMFIFSSVENHMPLLNYKLFIFFTCWEPNAAVYPISSKLKQMEKKFKQVH